MKITEKQKIWLVFVVVLLGVSFAVWHTTKIKLDRAYQEQIQIEKAKAFREGHITSDRRPLYRIAVGKIGQAACRFAKVVN